MTPSEMEALTEPWKPYRSIGKPTLTYVSLGEGGFQVQALTSFHRCLLHVGASRREGILKWGLVLYISRLISLCHPKMLLRPAQALRNLTRSVAAIYHLFFHYVIYKTFFGISSFCGFLSRALSSSGLCHHTNPRMCPVFCLL